MLKGHCRNLCLKAFSLIGFLVLSSGAAAGPIAIQQLSALLYADELGGAFEITELGYYSKNDFAASSISASFSSSLDNDNLGYASWVFKSNFPGVLTNVRLFLFLDADIDESVNSYFNERGGLAYVNGSGAADIFADSWEIDEPGYLFGDVYDNMLSGRLDNTNGVGSGSEDDVSLALGFELGDLNFNDSWTATIQLSLADIGGLAQFDDNSGFGFFFNGTVAVTKAPPVGIPEPGTLGLFVVAGLLARVFSFRK